MNKILWLDTETTGLDPVINDVIQIAGLVVVNGKEEEFNFLVKPHNIQNISPEALAVNKRTPEELETFDDPGLILPKIKALLKKYVNPFDKKDKFILAGQNVGFDDRFMEQFFTKCGDKYWYSWVHYGKFDALNVAIMLEFKEGKKLFPSYKLGAMCQVMEVELGGDNHDALVDIRATRALVQKMWKRLIK